MQNTISGLRDKRWAGELVVLGTKAGMYGPTYTPNWRTRLNHDFPRRPTSTLLLTTQKTATPQHLLHPISGNRIAGNELSPYLIGMIVGKYEEGRNKARIAKDLKLRDSTIRDAQRNEGISKSRGGGPPFYAQRTLRNRLVRTKKSKAFV